MGVMRILDQTGDTVISWDVDDASSVRVAAARFDCERRRRVPFARPHGAPASSARMITEFDPAVEEIIWTQPVVAG